MNVLYFKARPIRRPVAIVAVTQRSMLTALVAAFLRWWRRPPRPPSLPPYLLEDVGLPRDWRGADGEPLDLTVLHAWKRQ